MKSVFKKTHPQFLLSLQVRKRNVQPSCVLNLERSTSTPSSHLKTPKMHVKTPKSHLKMPRSTMTYYFPRMTPNRETIPEAKQIISIQAMERISNNATPIIDINVSLIFLLTYLLYPGNLGLESNQRLETVRQEYCLQAN